MPVTWQSTFLLDATHSCISGVKFPLSADLGSASLPPILTLNVSGGNGKWTQDQCLGASSSYNPLLDSPGPYHPAATATFHQQLNSHWPCLVTYTPGYFNICSYHKRQLALGLPGCNVELCCYFHGQTTRSWTGFMIWSTVKPIIGHDVAMIIADDDTSNNDVICERHSRWFPPYVGCFDITQHFPNCESTAPCLVIWHGSTGRTGVYPFS